MYTVRKILGKRGRTTIPYEFRQILDMRPQDVITFSINDDKNCGPMVEPIMNLDKSD